MLHLLSSGAASVWQVSTPVFQQLLEQATPAVACRALAELASSTVPIRKLEQAMQEQLEGLATESALAAAARSLQRCTVCTNQRTQPTSQRDTVNAAGFPACCSCSLRCTAHRLQIRCSCISNRCTRDFFRLLAAPAAGAACACDHHPGEVSEARTRQWQQGDPALQQ